MTATTTRAGTMPHDYEIAEVNFDTSKKSYYYWVPKAWALNPGDEIVVVSPSSGHTVVRVKSSGETLPVGNHKLALRFHKRHTKKRGADMLKIGELDAAEAAEWLYDELIADPKFEPFCNPAAVRNQFDTYERMLVGTTVHFPKEQPAMNIETVTFVNGQRIDQLTDAQLFDLIAKEEAKIKELSAIQNKPQRLKDAMNKAQADIDALVKLVDAR